SDTTSPIDSPCDSRSCRETRMVGRSLGAGGWAVSTDAIAEPAAIVSTTAMVDTRMRWLCLRLRLQLGVVLLEKRPDLVGHREELGPLLLVERHRKPPEPVDRDAAFFADLEAHAAAALTLQPFVLGFQSFQ